MSTRDGLHRVLNALGSRGVEVREVNGTHRARCPIHQGTSNDSLSVQHLEPKSGDRGGRARLRCFGGCDELRVLDLIGLTLADLYDEPIPAAARSAVREFPYLSGSGRVVGVVQRHRPKTFRPLTMQDGQWRVKSSEQLKGTPYRLPAVVVAVDRGDPVWVVEGERDADTLAREGIAATCNAGGADKWTDAHSRWLTGAHVTVCADADGPGRRHAAAVVASLTAVAASVRLVGPASGCKDITDHLAAGRTLDDLVEVTAPDPPPTEARQLRPVRASEVVMRRLRWVWALRVVLGGLTLLAGREGLGKSTLAVTLAAMVTRGTLTGELYGTPRTVIYVDSEDARDYTIVPRLVAADADLNRVVFLDAIVKNSDGSAGEDAIVLPMDTELLTAAVIEHNAALVVLDAATSVIDSRLDGDKDRQMRQALEAIGRRVGESTDAAVLGIVHFGKRDSADVGKLILGSIAWSQVARSTIAVAQNEDNGHLVISRGKGNLGLAPPSLEARIVPHTVHTPEGSTNVGRVEWLGETDHDAQDLLGGQVPEQRSELDEAWEWLKQHLKEAGDSAAGDVIRAAKRDGIAERTLQRARHKNGVTSRRTTDKWVWALPSGTDEQGADPNGNDGKAPPQDTVTSEDVKAPTDTHVQEAWRLGALTPLGDPLLCTGCGHQLYLTTPGRSQCEACRIKAAS